MRKVQVLFIIWLILAIIIYVLNGSKAAAAMFIVAALYCVAALLIVFFSGKKMTAKIKAKPEVDKGEEVQVSISASANSLIPVPVCQPYLSCVNMLTGEKAEKILSMPCKPKDESTTTMVMTSQHCGCQRITMKEALIADPAGLFRRRQELNAEASVYIMPEIRPVDIPNEYLDSYDMESYSYSQHRQGTDSGEVFDLREFMEGDSPKQIHWKISAKLDDLMVKLPSYPIENKLVVLLDNSIAEDCELSPEKRNDLMELFFSISSSLIKKNILHSIGWCNHETGEFVLKRVENESSMWFYVPDALSAGIEPSKISTAYRFLEAHSGERFNKHFIVTATGAAEMALLTEYGDVRVFTC